MQKHGVKNRMSEEFLRCDITVIAALELAPRHEEPGALNSKNWELTRTGLHERVGILENELQKCEEKNQCITTLNDYKF